MSGLDASLVPATTAHAECCVATLWHVSATCSTIQVCAQLAAGDGTSSVLKMAGLSRT